jgi:hypothetical protein
MSGSSLKSLAMSNPFQPPEPPSSSPSYESQLLTNKHKPPVPFWIVAIAAFVGCFAVSFIYSFASAARKRAEQQRQAEEFKRASEQRVQEYGKGT